MTGVNFNSSMKEESRSLSKDSKKVISMKQIKFPSKKNSNQNQLNNSSLPKPPLAKKNFLADTSGETFGTGSTAEALLRMADERLATIELELNQPKKNLKNNKSTIVSGDEASTADPKIKKVTLKDPKKQEIQTNFNLSFNNSFNTSYNNNSPAHP